MDPPPKTGGLAQAILSANFQVNCPAAWGRFFQSTIQTDILQLSAEKIAHQEIIVIISYFRVYFKIKHISFYKTIIFQCLSNTPG
jgi:hypothetical protein